VIQMRESPDNARLLHGSDAVQRRPPDIVLRLDDGSLLNAFGGMRHYKQVLAFLLSNPASEMLGGYRTYAMIPETILDPWTAV
jgi:hypothetical protein